MSGDVPKDFDILDEKGGFADNFGPVYINVPEFKIGFRVAPNHLNPVGVCHGGALATFADLQLNAVRSILGVDLRHRPTLNISVDYIAPAPLGSWVEATVTLVSASREIISTHALITANGKLAAQSRAIYHAAREFVAA